MKKPWIALLLPGLWVLFGILLKSYQEIAKAFGVYYYTIVKEFRYIFIPPYS